MIKSSLKFKSIDNLSCDFIFKPKTTLNQHLLKPIKPKKFEPKSKTIHVNGATSRSPLYMYNSLMNFNVPGNPEYKTVMIKIDTPKLGVVCINPEISETNRDLYRFCIQSTKKNIKDDSNECVIHNIIPPKKHNVSPQRNTKYNKLISWMVP